jgi:hypothetical protein
MFGVGYGEPSVIFGYFRTFYGLDLSEKHICSIERDGNEQMRKSTLDHHMMYFQYLNTTIYGRKRTYCHGETLPIPGALLVADPFESHVKETVTNIATQ